MFQTIRTDGPRRVLGKRRRTRRWLWRLRLLGKCGLGAGLLAGLAWVGYAGYTWVCQADYFRLRTVHITGNRVLSESEIRYLLALAPEITLLQLDLGRMGARME